MQDKEINFDMDFTDDPVQMEKIGKSIVAQEPQIYTDKMKNAILKQIESSVNGITDAEKESLFYRSIYDYWAYGFTIDQEFLYDLPNKTHEEKNEYLSEQGRFVYLFHMNDKQVATNLLSNKFNTYKMLPEFYRRDAVSVESEKDFNSFSDFVAKHSEFVVKPIGLCYGLGVHKESLSDYKNPRELFDKLLDEMQTIAKNKFRDYKANMSLILEELIDQDSALKKLHPSSVNCARIIVIKANNLPNIFYSWLRIGAAGQFTDNTGDGGKGYSALINNETGIVETKLFNRFNCLNNPLEYHPDTKIKILGMQIPRWDEAIELAKVAAMKFDNINYIAWDFALTPAGWVIVEGNAFGNIRVIQIILKKGIKRELENLIGWKPKEKFWWQYKDLRTGFHGVRG